MSPLLANLLLDDLNRELERRGHAFCRHADDCNIDVQSRAVGERVLASVTTFPEGRLKLRVNRAKSAAAPYYRHAEARQMLEALGHWVRRKLRRVRLKQRKRSKSIADFLNGRGVPEHRCWLTALSGKGWWRLAASRSAHEAMNHAWFRAQGLVDPLERYRALQT